MAAEGPPPAMASAIGIDLGTTYSCVGVWENGSVSIIANRMGNRTTPSWVAYRDNERLTGEAARSQAGRNPKFTLYDAKRLIGRKFSDPHVQEQLGKWPFKVVSSPNDLPLYEVKFNGETITVAPEEVSAAVLKEMKQIAEDYMGRPVTDAVITVPAYFNDGQRQSTKDAAEIAGLRVMRIINEPTAAALAYGFQKVSADQERPQHLLIFDLGGGTLDVTVLTVDSGVFEVRATCGDSQLGGQDFDNVLLEYFSAKYEEEHGDNIRTNSKSVMKLKEKCTEAKHTLSSALVATIEVDSLFDGNDYDANITRAKFNELSQPLLERCMGPVRTALADAAMSPADVDEVILVGGSTRIPEVQAMLERFFSGKSLNKRINPDEAVAFGAAIQAANLSLSTEQKAGSKLAGLTLLDVIPLSLGIELHNGKMSVLIPRNTSIPFRHSKTYYNNEDDQDEAIIEVFEGEHALAASNRLLGKFTVGPLPHRPRGKLKISVTFLVSSDGILEVSAGVDDPEANISQTVRIDGYKGLLSREEVSAMAETAKEFDAIAAEKAERQRAMDELQVLVLRLSTDLKGLSELADAGKKALFAQMLDEANVWIVSNKNGAREDILEVQRRLKAAWVDVSGEREFV